MTSGRYQRREEALIVLGAGAAIGAASGVVSLWVAPPQASMALSRLVLVSNFSYWTVWALLAVGVLRLARRIPINGSGWPRSVAIHLVGGFVFTFVHLKLWSLTVMLTRAWTTPSAFSLWSWLSDFRWLLRWQIEWEITMYWALIGLAHAIAYRQESRERALSAARLDAELSQARLQALQQQMHPHFLFNTLQSISALMHQSVESAELMIERLGELLRASLRSEDSPLVTVWEELEYVGHYVAIERLNFGDRLEVRQDVPADVLLCRIPRLLVQPLVENAIRHGLAPLPRAGFVDIRARRDGSRLELTVSDNGVGLTSGSEGEGIAIANTRRRLALLFPGEHEFEISPGPRGVGVVVRVCMPAIDAAVPARNARQAS